MAKAKKPKWPADQVERRKVEDLVPYARNARTHSEAQVAQIAASIKEWGWTTPALVTPDGEIIAGHGRVLAAQKLGLLEIPCMVAEGWTEAQKRAYIIADNKLAENAGWNEDLLKVELSDLEGFGFDLDLIGFDEDELNELLPPPVYEGQTDEDAVPEPPVEPRTKPGQLWILGDHRLYCGDATSQDDAAKLMDGDQADLVWTDPPYNVDFTGGTKDALKIMNDKMSEDDFMAFLRGSFATMAAVAAPGVPIYVAHAESNSTAFRLAMMESGFLLKQCLIWVKNTFALGRQDYQWQHEPILYGWREGAAHRWYGEFDKATVIDDDVDLKKKSKQELVRLVGNLLNERNTTVVREPKPSISAEHPTMKPIGLIEHMMLNSSKPGDLVFDPFGGSGSTLITAQKHRRCARLLELDPHYCDVIIKRWQNFTGEEAVLSDGKTTFESLAA